MRRQLILTSIGAAGLVTIAVVPSLRRGLIIFAAGFFAVFGLATLATARAQSSRLQLYVSLALAFVVGNGLEDGIIAGSLQQGIRSALGTAAIWVLVVGILAIVERRKQNAVRATGL
jgi:FtsH-binding integral membrane protein